MKLTGGAPILLTFPQPSMSPGHTPSSTLPSCPPQPAVCCLFVSGLRDSSLAWPDVIGRPGTHTVHMQGPRSGLWFGATLALAGTLLLICPGLHGGPSAWTLVSGGLDGPLGYTYHLAL